MEITKGTKASWFGFPVICKTRKMRDDLREHLERNGIETRPIICGNMTKQPGIKNIRAKKNNKGYPEADKVMRNGILIACHQGLTKKMINHIHKSIEEFMSKYI